MGMSGPNGRTGRIEPDPSGQRISQRWVLILLVAGLAAAVAYQEQGKVAAIMVAVAVISLLTAILP